MSCALLLKIALSVAEVMLFGQLVATCHTAESTHDVLRPFIEDRIISRRGDVVWPPRSYDLTPLVYYLWGAVKDKCYANKPETIEALQDNIREAIGEIQLHRIDNVLKNWTDCVGLPIQLTFLSHTRLISG